MSVELSTRADKEEEQQHVLEPESQPDDEVKTSNLRTEFEASDQNPFNWPKRRKWTVTLLACYITLIVGINSTAMTAASTQINNDFNISDASLPNSYWPVTSWNTGAAIVPMLILPLLEEYGLRIGYILSYCLFLIFVIPQAVAPNFATLIVTRFIAGCAGGVLQDVMDCIIADLFEGPEQRSLPVTAYVTCLLVGVSIGPIIGGAILVSLSWRWIFYVQLILYGCSLIPICLLFSETRGSVIFDRKVACANPSSDPTELTSTDATEATTPQHKSPSLPSFISTSIILPIHLLITEPVVLSFTLLSSLSYGLLFVGTQSVSQVYGTLYNFTPSSKGLVQSSLVIGEILGFFVCLAQNALFSRAYRRSSKPLSSLDSSVAESRLYMSIPGSFIGLAGGLFLYGWTSDGELSWVVPSAGLALIGCGSVVVMQAIMMYITDCYERYAGSASAAVCFGENAFAAFLPLASQAMYTNLGFHWASSLLAFIALLLSFAPVALLTKGRSIREKSVYMRKAAYSYGR